MSRFVHLAKTIPIIIGLAVLGLTTLVSVTTVTNKNFSFRTGSKAAAGEVKLSFSPEKIKARVGEKITLGVTLVGGEIKISGIDLKIRSDPQVLIPEPQQIVNTGQFQNVLLNKVTEKTLSYSAVTDSPKTVNAIILSIPFTAIAAGSAKIQFIPPTLVIDYETAKNVLSKTESADIVVGD